MNKIKGEVFKELTWTNGRYYVSNYGRIMSVGGENNHYKMRKKKIMKTRLNNNGYEFVKLFYCKKHHTFTVHKLVMLAFVGESSGLDINHIDGDKTNNKLDNLEYCTRKENMEHCMRLGLRKDVKKLIAIYKGKAVAKGSCSRELAENMVKHKLISSDTNIETFARQARKKADTNKSYKGFTFINISNL